MEDPSAVDMTTKYEQVFLWSLVTYGFLDLDLIITYFVYKYSQINRIK